jgi:hypothetical protein
MEVKNPRRPDIPLWLMQGGSTSSSMVASFPIPELIQRVAGATSKLTGP